MKKQLVAVRESFDGIIISPSNAIIEVNKLDQTMLWRSISLPLLERKLSLQKTTTGSSLHCGKSLKTKGSFSKPVCFSDNAISNHDEAEVLSDDTCSNLSSEEDFDIDEEISNDSSSSSNNGGVLLLPAEKLLKPFQEISTVDSKPSSSLKEPDIAVDIPLFKPVKLVRQQRYAMTSEQREAERRRRLNSCHICCSALNTEVTRASDGDCPECLMQICTVCFTQYLTFKIVEAQVSQKRLVCPGVLCDIPISDSVIKQNVSEDIYEKFLYFKQATLPGARFCPRVECGALQVSSVATKRKRKFTCDSCHLTSCMKCGEDYHLLPTLNCHRSSRIYKSYCQSSDVKYCPTCSWPIQKNGGCSHVSCSRCDAEFCWHCLKDWHNHQTWKCLPKSVIESNSGLYGPTVPVRAVTKSSVLVIGVVAGVVVGAGSAIVSPPYRAVKRWIKKRQQKRIYAEIEAVFRDDAFVSE